MKEAIWGLSAGKGTDGHTPRGVSQTHMLLSRKCKTRRMPWILCEHQGWGWMDCKTHAHALAHRPTQVVDAASILLPKVVRLWGCMDYKTHAHAPAQRRTDVLYIASTFASKVV